MLVQGTESPENGAQLPGKLRGSLSFCRPADFQDRRNNARQAQPRQRL